MAYKRSGGDTHTHTHAHTTDWVLDSCCNSLCVTTCCDLIIRTIMVQLFFFLLSLPLFVCSLLHHVVFRYGAKAVSGTGPLTRQNLLLHRNRSPGPLHFFLFALHQRKDARAQKKMLDNTCTVPGDRDRSSRPFVLFELFSLAVFGLSLFFVQKLRRQSETRAMQRYERLGRYEWGTEARTNASPTNV